MERDVLSRNTAVRHIQSTACDAESKAMEQREPKLLDRIRSAIRIRHYSPRTEEAYVGWIRRFILFHGKRHPREMGEAEVHAFLAALPAAPASCNPFELSHLSHGIPHEDSIPQTLDPGNPRWPFQGRHAVVRLPGVNAPLRPPAMCSSRTHSCSADHTPSLSTRPRTPLRLLQNP